MPQAHDRGGWPTDEPIDRHEHQWADWERRTHVLNGLLGRKGLIVVDEMRRGIEAIPPEQYESFSYYERWAASIETVLVEKGVLSREEIDTKAEEIEQRWG
jgi:hypothetical protein